MLDDEKPKRAVIGVVCPSVTDSWTGVSIAVQSGDHEFPEELSDTSRLACAIAWLHSLRGVGRGEALAEQLRDMVILAKSAHVHQLTLGDKDGDILVACREVRRFAELLGIGETP